MAKKTAPVRTPARTSRAARPPAVPADETTTPADTAAEPTEDAEPQQTITTPAGQVTPGFSNSPPAAEQDGIAGQRAKNAAPGTKTTR
jgi:hypothetical protein